MAKFGYTCKCGWTLTRGSKTRKRYSLAKRNHAYGVPATETKPAVPSCPYLKEELDHTPHS